MVWIAWRRCDVTRSMKVSQPTSSPIEVPSQTVCFHVDHTELQSYPLYNHKKWTANSIRIKDVTETCCPRNLAHIQSTLTLSLRSYFISYSPYILILLLVDFLLFSLGLVFAKLESKYDTIKSEDGPLTTCILFSGQPSSWPLAVVFACERVISRWVSASICLDDLQKFSQLFHFHEAVFAFICLDHILPGMENHL